VACDKFAITFAPSVAATDDVDRNPSRFFVWYRRVWYRRRTPSCCAISMIEPVCSPLATRSARNSDRAAASRAGGAAVPQARDFFGGQGAPALGFSKLAGGHLLRASQSKRQGVRLAERPGENALNRQWLDLTTPLGKGILAFLSALAEDERGRILARANGGRAAAKKRGVKFGPKPKLAAHQQREAVRMVREGQSLRAVAHHYHVGHSTIVLALERAT
jgi:hypothetical protein